MSKAIAVRIRQLTKAFAGRVVLGPVDLDFYAGDFVALLGHNGAGKSTLIKILDGVYTADDGTIEVLDADGRPASVGVVHQDLGLIETMSILDNLRLGRSALRHKAGYLDRKKERAAARAAIDRFGLDFDLDSLVRDLAPSERALLAVARVAAGNPRLIVLDETTSVLSSADAKRLIAVLRERSPEDISFVMVTHKLEEALGLANRVVVLRDGRVVCDQQVPLPSLLEITELLAPAGAHASESRSTRSEFQREPMLEFRAVTFDGIGPLDLTVHRGEAVAVTGRMGSALPNVGYLAGGRLAPESGQVWLRPGRRRAIVPPNREREGNLPQLTVRENLTIGSLRRWNGGLIRILQLGRERAAAAEMVISLGVLPANPYAEQRTLSGGNQQKVIFGRALLTEADVFVLCEPSRGVDVGTRRQIYALMDALKARGCALLIVAADPQDVLAVADRILVLEDGRFVAEYTPDDLSTEALARLV